MIELKKFTFNPFQENTYIVWDNESNESAIIDPGCFESKEETELQEYISQKDLQIKFLINTHCHIDHVIGNKLIKDVYDAPFYAPELDVPLLENLTDQAKLFGLNIHPSPLPDHFITEDLKLELGKSQMSFLFTPGHTPGEYCILFNHENICISGDVLFLQGIGRTDLYGGNYDILTSSIKNKLFVLDNETIVYPGHGENTTIGYEKEFNPFFR